MGQTRRKLPRALFFLAAGVVTVSGGLLLLAPDVSAADCGQSPASFSINPTQVNNQTPTTVEITTADLATFGFETGANDFRRIILRGWGWGCLKTTS